MRGLFIAVVLTCAFPEPLQAQARQHRLMAGAALNSMNPFDADVGKDLGPGLILRGVPKRGFGPVVDLSTFTVALRPSGERSELGELRMRAILGGAGYTVETGRFATTLHAAVGYAFSEAVVDRDVAERDRSQFDARDRPLLRTGLTLTWSAGDRVALLSSVGVLFVDPHVALTFNDASGRAVRTETGIWRTRALVWQVGVAYKFF